MADSIVGAFAQAAHPLASSAVERMQAEQAEHDRIEQQHTATKREVRICLQLSEDAIQDADAWLQALRQSRRKRG